MTIMRLAAEPITLDSDEICARCGQTDETLPTQNRTPLCEECALKLGLDYCDRCKQFGVFEAFLEVGDQRRCLSCAQDAVDRARAIHTSFLTRNADLAPLLTVGGELVHLEEGLEPEDEA